MLKTLVFACVFAVLAFMSTAAHAQTVDNRTFFTFSQPVTLPGVTLPAGKYLFRIPDTTASRRVVQVLSADGMQSYAMLLSIPAQRTDVPARPEVRFMETAENMPAAIKTWWYPGNTIGREFIYPKSQARRLAQATNTTVLTTQAENVTNEQMQTAELAYVSPTGQETALTDEQLVAAAANTPPVGATAESTTAQANTSAQSTTDTMAARTPAQEGTMARASLPRTSTPLAGIGLLGMLSLLGGAWLRFRA